MKNKFILAALMCSAAVISNAVGMNKDPSKYAQNKWRIMMGSTIIVGKYSESIVLNKNNIKIEHGSLIVSECMTSVGNECFQEFTALTNGQLPSILQRICDINTPNEISAKKIQIERQKLVITDNMAIQINDYG